MIGHDGRRILRGSARKSAAADLRIKYADLG
jgi:hypothetical protein